MNATALTWALLAAGQVLLSLGRPAWLVGFYLQTFFAAPHLWWWGRDVPTQRYALWAGIALAARVLFMREEPGDQGEDGERKLWGSRARWFATLYAMNATVVHFALSSRPDISIVDYVELMKYLLLFFLIGKAIRTRADFRLVVMAIAVGTAYIGWEVTINERGDFSGSRLEGVGAPAADTSNGLASVLLTALPLIGGLFVGATWFERLLVLVSAPLTLNVLLLCNSRGAFLGLIGGGLSFLAFARGPVRKIAVRSLLLGSVALYLLLGNPKIAERFATTFVGSEQRDNSASSRLVYWNAALHMLRDYPLGEGGGAFKKMHAVRYLQEVGQDEDARSIHNGYLTDATDWGVQGLALKLLFLWAAWRAVYRTVSRSRLGGRIEDSVVGLSLLASMSGFLINCLFGSFLNNEWFYWLSALMVRYSELYAMEPAATTTASAPANWQSPPLNPADAA